MNKLKEYLLQGENHFGSGTTNSPAFLSFYKQFKSILTKELKEVGADTIVFSKNHFCFSGFFTVNNQAWYFSLSDVRWRIGEPELLYRIAKSYKDFTGGHNQRVNIEEGMVKNMNL